MNQNAARVDAVAAGGQQAVVLVKRRLHALERLGHVRAGMVLHGHGACLVADDHVILEEGAGVLGDRVRCGLPVAHQAVP